ncbi:hypothetical protein HXX76_002172 [Chlamydomonas incerta]|uniref:UBC core domain-containing protein n=1 Tax=Chlamydomonas incerta TaxID=51695 RepID=A0A836B0M4_CHLIN|nr:hypothetical protein HXX76_002172 [Chlamydomonas incerta]|eukprot:KAG2443829.1 hypothetical protein HXX76_002172 [Chlamydomonas incerta]
MALSAVSINRMTRDVKEMIQAPPAGISAWATGNTISRCDAQVIGPEGTPYAGGVFQLRVTFPDRYPMEPPNVKFVTKVYHPNVSKEDGNICCSVLNMPPKGDWKPAHSLRTVLLSIQSLLAEPNPADPLDADAAREMTSHPQLFHSRAAEWTRLYASPEAQRAAAGASASTAAVASAAKVPAAGCDVAGASTAAPAPLQEQQPEPTSSAPATEVPSSTVPAVGRTTAHAASADGEGGGGGPAAPPSEALLGQAGDAGPATVGKSAEESAGDGCLPPTTGAAGLELRAAEPAAQGSAVTAAGAVESKRPPEPTSKLSKLSKRPRA